MKKVSAKGFIAHDFLSLIPPHSISLYQASLLPLSLAATLSHAIFSSLVNNVKQVSNVICSADARKLDEVYYS